MQLATNPFHLQARSQAAGFVKSEDDEATCRTRYAQFNRDGCRLETKALDGGGTCLFLSDPAMLSSDFSYALSSSAHQDYAFYEARMGQEAAIEKAAVLDCAKRLAELEEKDIPDIWA